MDELDGGGKQGRKGKKEKSDREKEKERSNREEEEKERSDGGRTKTTGNSLSLQFPYAWVLPEKKTGLPACAKFTWEVLWERGSFFGIFLIFSKE